MKMNKRTALLWVILNFTALMVVFFLFLAPVVSEILHSEDLKGTLSVVCVDLVTPLVVWMVLLLVAPDPFQDWSEESERDDLVG